MHFKHTRFVIAAAVFTIAGCSAVQPPTLPEVPAVLRPPAGQALFLEALATGVQIYECAPRPDSGYQWVFKAPEATLADRSGRSLGKHYAGPTWESDDGSTVVGEVKASDPGPNPSAIPWLLLRARSNSGSGAFSAAASVQRVATIGGIAPGEPCTAANVRQLARVPYTASYYFYRGASR
jgi:hypothetical protein